MARRFDSLIVNKYKGMRVTHVDMGVWDFHCTKCNKWLRAISSPKHAPEVCDRHLAECSTKEAING